MNTCRLKRVLNRYLIVLALILLQQNILLGQHNAIDSLKDVFRNGSSKSKLQAAYSLGRVYSSINRDSSILYYSQALKNTTSDSVKAEIHLAKAKILVEKEPTSFVLANQENEKAVYFARQHKSNEFLAMCLLQLSTSQNRIGKSNLALTSILEAKRLIELNTNSQVEYNVQNKLGIAYFNSEDYETAIRYFKTASSFAQDSNQVGMIHINMAGAFLKLSQTDSAIYHYKISLSHFLKTRRNLDTAYTGLSQAYLSKNQVDSALYYCQKWLNYTENSETQHNQYSVYFQFGKIYQKAGDVFNAEQYFLKTISSFHDDKKHNSKIRDAYALLSEINAAKGNYKKAYDFLKEFQIQNDSILAHTNKTKLNELLELHEFDTSEKELILQTKENEKVKWQNRALILLFAFCIIIGILILLLIRKKLKRYKIQEENTRNLFQQKKEAFELEYSMLSKEFNQKKQDLVSYSLQLINKKELLVAIAQELRNLNSLTESEKEKSITNLISAIRSSLGNDKDWDNFRNYFESIHSDFFLRLNKQYPKLTITDNRIAALTILGLDNKQAAAILDVEPESIKIAKNRLKKKLDLSADDDLRKKLNEFISEPN
jgi:tetratricopeptide (TPR) repeat protein/DNA-binding CsgD family transcriptional regulator